MLNSNPSSSSRELGQDQTAFAPADEGLIRDLHTHGLISLPGDTTAFDLENDIHPLYSQENFVNLTEQEYAYTKPALQLASRFLMEARMLPFWTHIYYGTHEKEQLEYGEYVEYIQGCKAENTRTKLAATSRELKAMASGLQIVMLDELSSNAIGCHALSAASQSVLDTLMLKHLEDSSDLRTENAVPRAHEQETLLSVADVQNPRIAFNHDYHAHIRAAVAGMLRSQLFAETEQVPAAQEVSFMFLFAKALVHETAHLFNLRVHRRPGPREPKWALSEPEWQSAEMGYSWELFALGCATDLWHLDSRPHVPLFSRDVTGFLFADKTVEQGKPCREDLPEDVEDYWAVVPLSWAHAWFREETWARIWKMGREDGRPALGAALVVMVYTDHMGQLAIASKGSTLKDFEDRGYYCFVPRTDGSDLIL